MVQRKLSTQAEIYTAQYFAIETIENSLVIGAQISLPLDGGSQEGSGGEGVDVGELGLLDAVRRVALHQVLPLPHVRRPRVPPLLPWQDGAGSGRSPPFASLRDGAP